MLQTSHILLKCSADVWTFHHIFSLHYKTYGCQIKSRTLIPKNLKVRARIRTHGFCSNSSRPVVVGIQPLDYHGLNIVERLYDCVWLTKTNQSHNKVVLVKQENKMISYLSSVNTIAKKSRRLSSQSCYSNPKWLTSPKCTLGQRL